MLTKVQKWRDNHQTCMQYVETFLKFDSETFFLNYKSEMQVVVFLDPRIEGFVLKFYYVSCILGRR